MHDDPRPIHFDRSRSLSSSELFAAYAAKGHGCGFHNGRRHDGARLVSISNRHARIVLPAGGEVRPGEGCILDSRLCADGRALNGLACRVNWVRGREVGVEFETALDVAAAVLHRALGDLPGTC